MLNVAVLTGRLTADVELKYTQNGKAVGSFNLAVNRQFKDANGNREADFIRCVIWGKSAESFANYMHKGSLTGIQGRIQTRNYDNQQGQKVYVTEVVVESWTFLESSNNGQSGNQSQDNYNNQNGYSSQGSNYHNKNNGYDNNYGGFSNNQGNNNNQNAGYGNTADSGYKNTPPRNDEIHVDDDDLPF